MRRRFSSVERAGAWRYYPSVSDRSLSRSTQGGLLKKPQESFDFAQDERTKFENVDHFPFMLSLSKHSDPIFGDF
jgi:hypothetical protein